MDFKELIADFAERHAVENLAADGNAAALDIDGIIVTLVAADDVVSISAEIGEPPSDGKGDFAELLLESNLQSESFFAKEHDSNVYVMVRRLSLPTLEGETFDAVLESFVNLVETWRTLLSDFRPVAAAAAASEAQEAPAFGTNGFVQV